MDPKPCILWLRRDLRLADNEALAAAAARGGPVLPVFIWSPQEEGHWPTGAASRWWLHHALKALSKSLEAMGSRLILRGGPAGRELKLAAKECGADAVFFAPRAEPSARVQEAKVKHQLSGAGIALQGMGSNYLLDPVVLKNLQGNPYQVFTPFWKAARGHFDPPRAAPRTLRPLDRWPASVALEELELLPRIDWAAGLRETWTPGEAGAHAALRCFLENCVNDYSRARDIPAERGTSRLSPHLAWGEITPRQILEALRETGDTAGAAALERQIYWREFAGHLLYHYPHATDAPLRPEFAGFPWKNDPLRLKAWQRGQTGYPIVDAAMRELWRTGWMHNRARMIVGSFLVKDLLIDWREGARWFWDTLVDAELANNTLGWQWIAGCGADAAPYFRVFNPALQAEKFDPDGAYVNRWAPDSMLPGYPEPIVNHARARDAALAAYARIKHSKTEPKLR